MIIDSPLEVKLYQRETVELPGLITGLLPGAAEVFQPEDADDIQRAFSLAEEKKLSLVPRGAATSGIGAITPLRRALLVDLTSLDKIIDIDTRKKTIFLEAGARWWEVKQCLKKYSLDLYTCPTSLFSTVGGWLSTGGFGLNSFKYGHLANAVESIEMVTPSYNKTLKPGHPLFHRFIGAEGQMGIISRVKLKVREAKPTKPQLVFFKNPSSAQNFSRNLIKTGNPSLLNISFFDRHRLAQKNHLLNGKTSFPGMEGVLVVFDDSAPDDSFFRLAARSGGIPAEDYLTSFLWNERFFPFSLKKFYPAILGCEVILPVENLSAYTASARELGESYGLHLATEATFINDRQAVVFTLFPSTPGTVLHLFHLLLTYTLARTALRSGGVPYGIGIWNLPLLKKKLSRDELGKLSRLKHELDPSGLLNTAKALSRNHPISYLLKLAYLSSALLPRSIPFKNIMKALKSNGKRPNAPVSEPDACANCGACSVVCPAFLMERNELVTAKGKLFLMKHLRNGSPVPQDLAEKAFLCLHCHLCEQVCQSKLTLIPLWEKLESRLEKMYGRPKEKIEEFVKLVEERPDYKNLLDLFSLSPQNNHRGPGHV